MFGFQITHRARDSGPIMRLLRGLLSLTISLSTLDYVALNLNILNILSRAREAGPPVKPVTRALTRHCHETL